MNKELKEVKLYDETICCDSYRFRYLEDKDIFNMQFADIIKEKDIVNIYYSTDFDERGFIDLVKSLFIASVEHYSLTGKDLIEQAIDELNDELND